MWVRTGAGVDAQTHRVGFVQPRVDSIHLVEHIVHIADAYLTELAFQADGRNRGCRNAGCWIRLKWKCAVQFARWL